MRDDDITRADSRTGVGTRTDTHTSYAEALKEIASSTKDLVRSEIGLVTAELKHVTEKTSRDAIQLVAFGALLAVSILPFIAFLVIGLGHLLGGRYATSSLIVAIVCAAVGGFMAYRAFKKIKEQDLDFHRTKESLNWEARTVSTKIDDVKSAAKGEHHGSHRLH